VRRGREPTITGADGLAVQRILAAIYQSSAEGRVVRLAEGAHDQSQETGER
jgi:predicted dehydrogenase